MIYCYDNAIAKDLEESFNGNVPVKVADVELYTELLAQAQNDEIQFPIVGLTRHPDTPIDTNRTNFTRMHKGVPSVFDTKENNIYYEKVIPIKLTYDLTILATNTADSDELVKELLFKYTNMYFITMELPYECKRKIRFGVVIDNDSEIKRESGIVESLHEGKLYQTIITLNCEGCVLVSYTPVHLKNTQIEDAVYLTDKTVSEP